MFLSVGGEEGVEAFVAFLDAGFHAAGDKASRSAKLSTSEVPVRRVRSLPMSSKRSFSNATLSGIPSKVNVCTISSLVRMSWNGPWKPASNPSRRIV